MKLSLKCVSGKYEVSRDMFSTVENLSASGIHKWLQNVSVVNVICSWVYRFHEEKWKNIHNAERSGRLSETSTDKTRRVVLAIVECDQKFTIRIWDLLVNEHSIEVSHMTVQHVLATEGYTKLCVRWVSNS